ncbi:MAG: hypothetical protein IJ229_10205 [Clostridia bacterium]|nr:hypothetical protein [Clostridia bacterium]MBR1576798.1 hypothetical protein [Bacteroidales bacterium]
MKKEYKPLNLVMNGRYAALFGKLSPEEQQAILCRIGELIEAEKEYTDKGNYGHFCNILPTISIDEVLQRHGKSADEAFIPATISLPKNPCGLRVLLNILLRSPILFQEFV